MQKLFSAFKPASKADWEQQLMKDLKGVSPEELIWENENGIRIKSFYTKADNPHKNQPAFIHSSWEVGTPYREKNAARLNQLILEDLNRGVSSIAIDLLDLDLETVFKGVQLNHICAVFYLEPTKADDLKLFLEKHYVPAELNLSLMSKIFRSENDLKNWGKVHRLFDAYPNIKTFSADLSELHNQNVLPYYELALAFSILNETLNLKDNLTGAVLAKDLVIRTAVNADFFIQIAKLRAYRRLWEIIKKEYGLKNKIHLIVETGFTNKSISDNHNNLIRTTVESMSGIIGGCDELIVHGYDEVLNTNNRSATRLAINQQLILKYESYLDKMADISCGSYYVETLTDELAKRALTSFKEIEKAGGYFKAMENNRIGEELDKQSRMKMTAIQTGKEILVGVNKFISERSALSDQSISELKSRASLNSLLHYELENRFKV